MTDQPSGVAADPDSGPDAMPQPPPELDFEACCGNGCDPCIVDLHDLAMDAYRQALRAWKARHPEADQAALAASSPKR